MTAPTSQQPSVRGEFGESFYRAVIEAAIDGFWIVDQDGRILEVNESYARMSGYSRGELCGMRMQDLDAVESAEQTAERLATVMARGQQRFETQHRRKDGSLLHVEVSAQVYPGDGHFFVFVRDTSLRHKHREDLGKLRSAVEQSANAILITDKSGTIEYANPAAALSSGYPVEELVGQRTSVLKSGEQDDEFYRELWLTISAGETWHGEFRNRRKDGALYWESATISPIFDSDGRILRFVAIKEDITGRRELEDNLRDALKGAETASRAKSEFLNIMSYELRTPLSTVLGFAELLSTTTLDDSQNGYLQAIRDGGQRLLQILSDILDYSTLEKGRLQLERSPVGVTDLAESCHRKFEAAAREKGLTLSHVVEPGLPGVILGDGRRILQILGHLVGNAVKFTDRGSVLLRILPSTSEGRSYISFSIEDTGPGISQDLVASLFEAFTQADSTLTRRFGGAGLGLTLSRGLAEAMDGGISVSSEIGRGSNFVLTLPLDNAGPGRDAESGQRGPAPRALPGAKPILVAEDDIASAMVVRKMLSKLGYESQHCPNGKIAVEVFSPDRFSAVLMDLRMPVMDGVEAAQRIRESNPEGPDAVPIIALTANIMPGDRKRCFEAGMSDYLTKPIRLEDLASKLSSLIKPA